MVTVNYMGQRKKGKNGSGGDAREIESVRVDVMFDENSGGRDVGMT